jgi:hypothetical protein
MSILRLPRSWIWQRGDTGGNKNRTGSPRCRLHQPCMPGASDAMADRRYLSFEELPVPRAGPGEILVTVAVASVNQIDSKLPEGKLARLVKPEFPRVPGRDCVHMARLRISCRNRRLCQYACDRQLRYRMRFVHVCAKLFAADERRTHWARGGGGWLEWGFEY